MIGGDTARAASVILAVTGLGDLAGRNPVLRSGAAPGDLVAVAGPLGPAAAGLALLAAGLTHDPLVTPLVAAHLRPAPPYDAGPEAADLGATAMIDISDGLLADLGHVAAASGVRIDLDSGALRPGDRLLAAARAVADAAVTSERTWLAAQPTSGARWVMSGGEDHSLAATFPPGTRLPPRWRVIGSGAPRVTASSSTASRGPKPPAGITSPARPGRLTGDLACLDAGGADVDPLGRAADHGADRRWMFGFQRRRVRRCENETLLPKPGPLPHTSQTEATVRSID